MTETLYGDGVPEAEHLAVARAVMVTVGAVLPTLIETLALPDCRPGR
jgi:hypothetical protein